MTTALTLTDPMRTCSVSSEILAAATSINTLLESSCINDGHIVDMTNIADEVKRLKKLVSDINDARIDPFRPIDEIRSELKIQIDLLILAPLNAKITEYEAKIKAHNDEVKRLEIAAIAQMTQVTQPIPAAIKQRQKPYICECVDVSKVPDAYKMTVFNQKKADAEVRCGLRQLAGCKIYRPR